MALPKVVLRDFRGGLNTNDVPAELADNEAATCLNLTVDKVGRLRALGGQHTLINSQTATMQGLLRYANASVSRLCFATGGVLWAFDEYNGTYQTLASNLSTSNNIEMAAMYDRLFYVDGVGIPGEWFGDLDRGAQQAGITAPGTACTAASGAAGALNGTYQYYVVYGNAKGVRSNPSPISNAVAVANQQMNLTAIPVSPDTQVTLREIYRSGGTATTIRLVGTVSGNTSTTFTDNTSDNTLSLTQMQQANDVAPPGATVVLHHQNRLWLAGFGLTPYKVWFSSYGQPEYFPALQKNLSLDGTYFEVPPVFDDPIVGLSSTGSALVIGRKKSIYVALGTDDAQNMRVRPVSNIGVASHRSMVNCGNVCVFLGSDGMVYQLGDNVPQPLGLKIEKTLQNLTGVYFQYASAAYCGQRYILCIPQAPGQTPLVFAYDFRVEAWSELSDALMNAVEFYADQSRTVAGELLFATGAGYKDPATSTSYNGIVSTLCATDLITPRRVTYKTKDFDMGEPKRWKRVKSIKITGTCVPADATKPMTATIITDLATHSYPFTKQAGTLLDTTVHADLMGTLFSVTLDGTLTQAEINTVEIEYAITR